MREPLPRGFFLTAIALVWLHLLEEWATQPGMVPPGEIVLVTLFGSDVPHLPTRIGPWLLGLGVIAAIALAAPSLWKDRPWADSLANAAVGLFVVNAAMIHFGALMAVGGPSSQTLGRVPGLASALLLLLPLGIVWLRLGGVRPALPFIGFALVVHVVLGALVLLSG
jgi:hypothetical protein